MNVKSFYDNLTDQSYWAAMNAGNILVPFLLTDQAVNMNDQDMKDILSVGGFDPLVESFTVDDLNIRVIITPMEEGKYNNLIFWVSTCMYVQMWDDEHIWAQPIYEDWHMQPRYPTVFKNQAGDLILVFYGPNIYLDLGLHYDGTGFVFRDGVWQPFIWADEYEYEDLSYGEYMPDIKVDGFHHGYVTIVDTFSWDDLDVYVYCTITDDGVFEVKESRDNRLLGQFVPKGMEGETN